ncbi:hypothetical protein D3C72_1934300 [compost metagenome]
MPERLELAGLMRLELAELLLDEALEVREPPRVAAGWGDGRHRAARAVHGLEQLDLLQQLALVLRLGDVGGHHLAF